MVKDYEDWKKQKEQEDNPDLECFDTLLKVTKQYLKSPRSKACISLLIRTIECSEKWIGEKRNPLSWL